MSTLTRKESRPFSDLFDWMDSPMTVFRPFSGQNMRMEDYVRDGHYIVRAEMPGVDPDSEVDLSVNEGVLTIRADDLRVIGATFGLGADEMLDTLERLAVVNHG